MSPLFTWRQPNKRSKYQMLRSPERGLRGITREKAPRPWVKTRELQVHLGQQSTQAGSGQGQHVTEVLSLILPALYLGCAIWWDCLAQTPPSIPELQQLAEATQIGEPASSSAEVRQLVDHLSEQAREVASEASMERTPSCNVDGWANASIRYLHSACSKGPGL